ncbi:ISL3 family transposase [Gemmatimonas sp.]|uniref:ISL3 family transposase n=1 Tax=Gemmatimonas sp. TaxID=1962908 RepID=UPI00333F5DB5
MRITTVFKRLLGVTSTSVEDVGLKGEAMVVDVSPSWRRPRCPECGKPGTIHETREPRLWRDLAFGETVAMVRYAARRVACVTHGVHVEAVPWAAPKSRFTRRMEELVAYLAQQMSKTAVCKLAGIDWRTVGTIVTRIINDKLDPTRLDDLTVIGVDELSFRRNHNYVTVVVDHVRQRIVWVGEGKSSATLAEFFKALGPERAKLLSHVTMDLSAAYRASVTAHAPQAELVFDRFHIQRLASDAVDAVRRSEVRAAESTDDAKALKGMRWPLLKSPWNLNADESAKLADLQRANQRIFRAYLLKEGLADILRRRQPGVAARELTRWCNWAARSRLKPFVKLSRTIKQFSAGILAYIRTGLSNGPTEGLNNKTRLITRRAYGFHSAQALIAMIFLCCGGIMLSPPLPSPTGSP